MKLNAHMTTGAIIPIEGRGDRIDRLSREIDGKRWLCVTDSNVFLNLDHVAALVPSPEPLDSSGQEALIDRDGDIWLRSDTDPDMWKRGESGESASRSRIEECCGPVRRVQIMELGD